MKRRKNGDWTLLREAEKERLKTASASEDERQKIGMGGRMKDETQKNKKEKAYFSDPGTEGRKQEVGHIGILSTSQEQRLVACLKKY